MGKQKKTNRRKKGISPVLIALFLIVLCAAGYLVWRRIPTKKRISAADYFGITSEDEVGVIADIDQLGTAGRMIDGRIYLDYESARVCTNGIWYDAQEQLLVAAGPSEKKVFSFEEGHTTGGEAVIYDDTLYISCEFLKTIEDLEIMEMSDPNRVLISNTWEYPAVSILKNAPVRVGAGIKCKVVTNVSAGDLVRATDLPSEGAASKEKTPGWTRVLTRDGMIGYVEDRFVGESEIVSTGHIRTAAAYEKHFLNEKVNLCFHQTTDQASNNALEQSLNGVEGINVLAPTWFFLDSENGDLTSLASQKYVETAHKKGLFVWPVLNDFDGAVSSADVDAKLLGSYAARTKVVDTVVSELLASGADGLNIDFEKVRAESADAFIEFLRELAVEMQKADLTLSVDNYVPKYTKYLNRKAQAECADYIVVMCYDETTSGSKKAGSNASLPFVKQGISDTLSEVPAEQVIAAIPFYTRLWKTPEAGGENPSASALGMSGAESQLETYGMTASWNEECGQNYAETKADGMLIQLWLEDARSIEAKMQVIQEFGLAGVAEWKLGLEKPEIWSVISEYLAS